MWRVVASSLSLSLSLSHLHPSGVSYSEIRDQNTRSRSNSKTHHCALSIHATSSAGFIFTVSLWTFGAVTDLATAEIYQRVWYQAVPSRDKSFEQHKEMLEFALLLFNELLKAWHWKYPAKFSPNHQLLNNRKCWLFNNSKAVRSTDSNLSQQQNLMVHSSGNENINHPILIDTVIQRE